MAWRYPDEAEKILDDAGKLPLWDAAYLLWSTRDDRAFYTTDPPPIPIRSNSIDDFKRLAYRAMVQVKIDMELGHVHGRANDRLLSTHPDATDEELSAALRAAIDLETFLLKNFDDYLRSRRPLREDTERLHPGFSAQTYSRAYARASFLSR